MIFQKRAKKYIDSNFHIDNEPVEIVQNYTYLGTLISSTNNLSLALDKLKEKALHALFSLRKHTNLRKLFLSGERPRRTHIFTLRLNFNFCVVFFHYLLQCQILISVNMPTNSALSLKKKNQDLKAQINVLFGEIENIKLQLGDGESTAAAEQTVKDHQSPTNEAPSVW